MAKTISEINEKISKGKAVVVTADEIIDIVEKKGVEKAARKEDPLTRTDPARPPLKWVFDCGL